jgi:hypothetical protein
MLLKVIFYEGVSVREIVRIAATTRRFIEMPAITV